MTRQHPGFRGFQLGAALAFAAMFAGGAAASPPPDAPADTAFTNAAQRWRADRESRLKADGGWLTVAGLYWLKPGDNRFGTEHNNDVVLPEGSALPRGGFFQLAEGEVRIKVFPDETVSLDGKSVTYRVLKDDSGGAPDVLHLGRLTMQVIKRQDRFGIRLKDRESQFRKDFTGLRWYPIDPRYRVSARFKPYDPPKKITVPNVLGQVEEQDCPGAVEFEVDGQKVTLEPVAEAGDDSFFFIFSDGTSGEATYPGGRFLDTDLPKDGVLILDFNRAYNPPCAFTPYATCPLPPEENRLKVAIPAGELNYGEHH